MSFIDYYKILKVSPDANEKEIKEAYRRLVKLYHPDVNKSLETTQYFIEIRQAYGILIDPIKRKEYDDKNRKESESTATKAPNSTPVELLYVFPTIQINTSAIIEFGEMVYALSSDQTNGLYRQGILRGVALKTRNYKNYCHRCSHQWEALTHSQSPRTPKYCPQCRAIDWSEFLILRCSHCSAVFEYKGDIREKIVENQKGKLFSPYEIFPRCPNCKRSRWCLGEEDRLQTQQQKNQAAFQGEKDQQQSNSDSSSVHQQNKEKAQNSFPHGQEATQHTTNTQETISGDGDHSRSSFPGDTTSQQTNELDVKFEKLSKQALAALSRAKQEAERFEHDYIDTEHLLLALIHEDKGRVAQVLANLSIERNKVRSAIEYIIVRGKSATPDEIRLNAGVEKAIELAFDEAHRLKHQYIGTEHLLLGLIREGEGIAASVLESLDISLEKTRTTILTMVQQEDKEQIASDEPSEESPYSKHQAQAIHKTTTEQTNHTATSQPPRPRQDRRFSRRLIVIGLVGASFTACYSFGRIQLLLKPQQQPLVHTASVPISAQSTTVPTVPGSSDQTPDHPHYILATAWSPDGKQIAFSGGDFSHQSSDTPVVIRSVEAKGEVFVYHHLYTVLALGWSPHCNYVASISEDGNFQVWNITKKTLILTSALELNMATLPDPCLAWSPNDKYIVTGDQKSITIWNLLTNKREFLHYVVWSLAWSPNGKYIAAGNNDTTILVWEAPSGNNTFTYGGHDSPAIAIDWSPDSLYIVSTDDFYPQVWNAKTGRLLLTYRGHSRGMINVKWSPNGKYIASSARDETVQVWNAKTGNTVFTYRGHSENVVAIAWSPDSRWIASGSGDQTMQVWNAFTGELRFTDRL